MYVVPPMDEMLAQDDIIDGCPLFTLKPDGPVVDLMRMPDRWEARVIILTQACDLVQAKKRKVVVAWVREAQELVEDSTFKAQTIRDQVRRHQVFGWYFLPSNVPASMPESLVDFGDLHTVDRAVLEHLVGLGKRVCRLVTPFREHHNRHLGVTYSRIGLPEPYATEA
ncbi:MAG: hypothetical protein K2W96_01765 [Gemmataceae bacterium]|nr:hypothetical protein [Gemmataceae bacterium]